MFNKIGLFLGLVLLVLVLMVVSRPDQAHFEQYIKSSLSSEMETAAGDKNVQLLDKLIKKGLVFQASNMVEYQDKTFYAVARTHIGNRQVEYIGAFGQWIDVSTFQK